MGVDIESIAEVSIMNTYVTGAVIKELREKNKMTQCQLAEALGVSDKAVSKWETGKGYPDITLLEPISKIFHVSITELFSGDTIRNTNTASNMLKTEFYVCPVCGNVIHSTGEAAVNCHGILLTPEQAEPADENHGINIECIEGEYYVQIDHPMTKSHYISFIAAISPDRIEMVKLYPEGGAEARLKLSGVRKIYYYCNKDGMFEWKYRLLNI